MKRRVIQHGPATLIVSLPSAWVKRYGIRKGDELDIEERGTIVTISTEKGMDLQTTELDVSGLDRTSIMYAIRSCYRMGYQEIIVKFSNPTCTHFRTKKEYSVTSIIQQEINRLVGVEIIQQRPNQVTIRDISGNSPHEFDTIMRRVFILLIDATEDFVSGAAKFDKVMLENVENTHDNVTKFASYCLRLLNKSGYHDYKKTAYLYHIVATLDKIMDIVKYSARDVLAFDEKPSKEAAEVLAWINESLKRYYEFYYKYDANHITTLSANRDKVKCRIRSLLKKIKEEDILLISNMEYIQELLLDLTEARTGLELQDTR